MMLRVARRLLEGVGILALLWTATAMRPAPSLADGLLPANYSTQPAHRLSAADVARARVPVVDLHLHACTEQPTVINKWVRTMNGICAEPEIIQIAAADTSPVALFGACSASGGTGEAWPGIDMKGCAEPECRPKGDADMERCVDLGGRGIGEPSDRRKGLISGRVNATGRYPQGRRVDPVSRKAGELGLIVNLRVVESRGIYFVLDSTNCGLVIPRTWRPDCQPNIVGHSGARCRRCTITTRPRCSVPARIVQPDR